MIYKLIFLFIILFLLALSLPSVKKYIRKECNKALIKTAQFRYAHQDAWKMDDEI